MAVKTREPKTFTFPYGNGGVITYRRGDGYTAFYYGAYVGNHETRDEAEAAIDFHKAELAEMQSRRAA